MSELSRLLQQLAALSEVPEPSMLKQLIDMLRVSGNDPTAANAKLQSLIDLLKLNPDLAAGLAAFILKLINQYREVSLYTDTGILSDQTFMHSMSRLVSHRILPLLPQDDSIIELIDYLFDKRQDEDWLAAISPQKWDELVDLVKVDQQHLNLVATAKNNILNAIVILSYRITGIGLHPELMSAYPQLLNYTAAFVAQNQEAVLFVNQYRQTHALDQLTDIIPENDIDPAPLLVMLDQCESIVASIRKRIYKTGISIRLTNMLVRLDQSIQRMRTLTELVMDNEQNRDQAIIDLTQVLLKTAKRRYSFTYLINNNAKLLSRKITENASRVGEHYISTDKSGYRKMFKKASIGGFVIAFMATLKILAYDLALAPMGRAFVNSMIYGLGFVFIHTIHGTVATKQPAMTAAAIASTISDGSGKKIHQLNKLSELIVDILRTQFIAIMGNVLLAMPIAFLISFIWVQYFGVPMVDAKHAAKLVHELNPIESLALPHAAIAGVFLFLSGLIAGYYDNLAVFNHIGERIRRHWLLIKIMPRNWLNRFSIFVETNLGAIMGNFLFGVFLGSTATVGYLFGLPLDIRHIAFASANFAHGIFNTPVDDLTMQMVIISLVGVALIGLVNLMVSFSLALIVALRAKEVRFMEWGRLTRLLFDHLRTHPLDFIWPRTEPMKYARIDSQGQMIFEEATVSKHSAPPLRDAIIRRLADGKKIATVKDDPIKTQGKNVYDNPNPSSEAYTGQVQEPTGKNQAVATAPTLAGTGTQTADTTDAQPIAKQKLQQQRLIENPTATQEENGAQASDTGADSQNTEGKGADGKTASLPKPEKPPNLPD